MGKGNGTTRASSSSSPRGLQGVSNQANTGYPNSLTEAMDLMRTPSGGNGITRYSEAGETWYEGTLGSNRIRILQDVVGSNSWWNAEINRNLIVNADGRAMAFESPDDAYEEILDTLRRRR